MIKDKFCCNTTNNFVSVKKEILAIISICDKIVASLFIVFVLQKYVKDVP